MDGAVDIEVSGYANRLEVISPFDFSHSLTDEGIAYEIKGDEQRALKAYSEALNVAPRYMRALEHLGKLQMKRKDYSGARNTYGKILEITPDSVEARYQLMRMDKLGL